MNNDETLGIPPAGIGGDAPQQTHKTGPRLPRAPQADAPIGLAADGGIALSKKTILLVDSNLPSRESRAKVMRARGVHVDCVSNAEAARARLAAETYNLILVDLGRNVAAAETLVQEIRAMNSRQLVRFLVGSPLFVATSLNGNKSKPHPAPAPASSAVPRAPKAPGASGIDFGQKVREAEAEAEETASEARGAQDAAGR
ncbi:MAG: response regulator [Candidatus Korobacteraceae bacterium]